MREIEGFDPREQPESQAQEKLIAEKLQAMSKNLVADADKLVQRRNNIVSAHQADFLPVSPDEPSFDTELARVEHDFLVDLLLDPDLRIVVSNYYEALGWDARQLDFLHARPEFTSAMRYNQAPIVFGYDQTVFHRQVIPAANNNFEIGEFTYIPINNVAYGFRVEHRFGESANGEFGLVHADTHSATPAEVQALAGFSELIMNQLSVLYTSYE